MAMEMEEQDWGNERGREGRREGRKDIWERRRRKSLISVAFVILIIPESKWMIERNE